MSSCQLGDKGARFARLRRAIGFAAPFRKAVFVIFLFTLGLAGVNAAEPLVLKYLFDNLTTHPEATILISAVIGLLILGVFRELASGFSNWLTWHTRLNVHYEAPRKTGRGSAPHASLLPPQRRCRRNHDQACSQHPGLH